jgi:hypothetical protein
MNRHCIRRRAERGFSLIEALFAGVLVLVMMLFILPLFTRAMTQNVAGRESSIASTHGKWTIEELNQLPLDRKQFELTGGTELAECKYWDRTAKAWVTYACGAALPGGTLWHRETRYQQFAISDLMDDRELNTPTPGGTPFEFVHLRELAVEIQGERENPLGPARRLDFVTVRGF